MINAAIIAEERESLLAEGVMVQKPTEVEKRAKTLIQR
jgi:hypothetical protein